MEACTIDMGGPQSTLDNTVRIHGEVSSSGASADVVGLSNSTLRLRNGKDDLVNRWRCATAYSAATGEMT